MKERRGVSELLPLHVLMLRKNKIQMASPPQALSTKRTLSHSHCPTGPVAVDKEESTKGDVFKISSKSFCIEK